MKARSGEGGVYSFSFALKTAESFSDLRSDKLEQSQNEPHLLAGLSHSALSSYICKSSSARSHPLTSIILDGKFQAFTKEDAFQIHPDLLKGKIHSTLQGFWERM